MQIHEPAVRGQAPSCAVGTLTRDLIETRAVSLVGLEKMYSVDGIRVLNVNVIHKLPRAGRPIQYWWATTRAWHTLTSRLAFI